MRPTTFAGKTVLVTGANRGLGQALVAEALRRGARAVYAGTRQPLTSADERVTPLLLDVTDRAQIQSALDRVDALDILINNAGVSVPDDLNDRSAVERHLAVNLYGTLDVTRASLPLLTRNCGAVVNIVSLGAVAGVPVLPAYDLQGRRALAYAVVPRLAGWPGRERVRGPTRSDRHRHGARSGPAEDRTRGRGARHARGRGAG